MSDTANTASPDRGFPNPALDPNLVDHDAQLAEQAEASRKAAEQGDGPSGDTPPENPTDAPHAAY